MSDLPRTADVVIVGGGIMGCGIALELARRGVRAVVLERSFPGAEASTAAAGILAPQIEAEAPGPVLDLGLASRALYPGLAAQLRDETGVDVGWRACGALQLAFDEETERHLGRRFEWQRAAALRVERLDVDSLRRHEPELGPGVRSGLRFPDDHQVDPRPLMRALGIAAERAGARFVTGAQVHRVLAAEGRVTGVELSSGVLGSRTVVLAAGSWTGLVGGTGLPPDVVQPLRGQIVALDGRRRLLDHIVFGPGGYVVPRADGRVLAGSTQEMVGFDRTVTAAAVHHCLSTALRLCPALGRLEVSAHWANFRPRAADSLPLIGPLPSVEGLLVASGHLRNGILLAPLTARIIGGLVLGEAPMLDISAFSPARFQSAV